MGNTSIAHSKDLTDRDDNPFAVIFDPAEVETALDIPPKDISIIKNTLFPDLTEKELCKVLCFPFAQHYLADSPGCRTYVKNYDDMISIYNNLGNLKDFKTFSPKIIKNQLIAGISIIALILLSLHIFVF